jgi:phage terminase small subunit
MSATNGLTTPIEPPAHLSAAAQEWWRDVLRDFTPEAHHLRVLQLAAEAWDRAQSARESLDVSGLVYIDRFDQPKPRPEAAIARDNAALFARLLRELGLDIVPKDTRLPRPGGRY